MKNVCVCVCVCFAADCSAQRGQVLGHAEDGCDTGRGDSHLQAERRVPQVHHEPRLHGRLVQQDHHARVGGGAAADQVRVGEDRRGAGEGREAAQVEHAQHHRLHHRHQEQGERPGDALAKVQAQLGEDPNDHGRVEGLAAVQALRGQVHPAPAGRQADAPRQSLQGDQGDGRQGARAAQGQPGAAQGRGREQRHLEDVHGVRGPHRARRLPQDCAMLDSVLFARDRLRQDQPGPVVRGPAAAQERDGLRAVDELRRLGRLLRGHR